MRLERTGFHAPPLMDAIMAWLSAPSQEQLFETFGHHRHRQKDWIIAGAVKAQELENVIGPKNNRPLDQADAGN
jgi:hypothetical protein